VRDCLEEAMDFDGLARARRASIAAICGSSRATRRSRRRFAHEILNARPYAFLDDAPLEERRTHAVQTRARRADRAPTISARSTPRRSSACATRRGPIRATPTSCTTRCGRAIALAARGALTAGAIGIPSAAAERCPSCAP
jgi:hypothetical protein